MRLFTQSIFRHRNFISIFLASHELDVPVAIYHVGARRAVVALKVRPGLAPRIPPPLPLKNPYIPLFFVDTSTVSPSSAVVEPLFVDVISARGDQFHSWRTIAMGRMWSRPVAPRSGIYHACTLPGSWAPASPSPNATATIGLCTIGRRHKCLTLFRIFRINRHPFAFVATIVLNLRL